MNRKPETAPDPDVAGYHVDDLVIDLGRQRVTRGETELQLPGLSFELLLALVRAAPNLLTYDQLMERVWPGVVVNPETVTQRVKLVRDALDDDSHKPRYIARVRNRGYRMIPAIEAIEASSLARVAPSTTNRAKVDAPRDTPRVRPWGLIAATVAALAVLAATGAAVVQQVREREGALAARTTVAVKPGRTIAVLPFANISGDPENEYFSDGLTEELLHRLASVPRLQVAARTSAFHFKDKPEDVRRIGKLLGVGYVLEGGVRKQGDRVRVNAQLINADDGYHLWSSSFDRPLADIFRVQEEIALAVADNLKLTLLQDERTQFVRRPTRNLEAYDLYLRARHLYQSMQLERIDKAIQYFEQAIALDPAYADAYVALADAISLRGQIAGGGFDEMRAGSRRNAVLRRAIELDPRNADAHALLGHAHAFGRGFAEGARELHLAEALNPNGELTLRCLAQHYGMVGWPPERAIDYARKGLRLDPLNPWAATNVAIAYWHSHQSHAALAAVDQAIELDPDFWVAHWVRDIVLMDLDRNEEAVAAAKRAVELSGGYVDAYGDLVVAYARSGQMDAATRLFDEIDRRVHEPRWRPAYRAFVLSGLGRYEESLASLEQAYREEDGALNELLHYRIMIPLHDDPRFRALARKLKLEHRVEHTRAKNAAHIEALRQAQAGGSQNERDGSPQ